jgi:hypothetical protein
MNLAGRIVIGLLSGIGSGLLGFWAVWQGITHLLGDNPGVGYDIPILTGIFVPFVVVAFLVFRHLSLLPTARPSDAG